MKSSPVLVKWVSAASPFAMEAVPVRWLQSAHYLASLSPVLTYNQQKPEAPSPQVMEVAAQIDLIVAV